MNIFFATCWGASYLAMLANFVIWGYRWSVDIGNDKATAFWGLMVVAFLALGLYVIRSISASNE